jgi:alpha-tubulin suppressor-like RCC1 family protein
VQLRTEARARRIARVRRLSTAALVWGFASVGLGGCAQDMPEPTDAAGTTHDEETTDGVASTGAESVGPGSTGGTADDGAGQSDPWVVVSAGRNETCAVRQSGTLWCWGQNAFGRLDGSRPDEPRLTTPVRIGDASDWEHVSNPGDMRCAIKYDGSLWCWERNEREELGLGDDEDRGFPTLVSDAGWAWTACGGAFSCGLTEGKVLCWGWPWALFGRTPTLADSGEDWAFATTGWFAAFGVRSDGSLWGWGMNSDGLDFQGIVGIATDEPHVLEPTPLPVNGTTFRSAAGTVTSGRLHSCAIADDGALWCWGDNTYGQLGNGAFEAADVPVQIGDRDDWVWIDAGRYGSCAIDEESGLWCWGDNRDGQLGIGTTTPDDAPGAPAPVRVVIEDRATAQRVSAGADHTCAIVDDGWLYCWGDNSHGELGLGDEEPRTFPVLVSGPTEES